MTSAVIDTATGEMIETPTIPEINRRMIELSNALDANTAEVGRLASKKARVDLEYRLRFAASVAASSARSMDQRKAEAELNCNRVEWEGLPLVEAMVRLDMQLRAEREAGHNIRAQLSALQTVANNLRAEARIAGWTP